MTRNQHHELDDVAWCILRTLQSDARAPLKTLAQAAGLSVAGADSYLMTVVAASMDDLERFIGTINPYGETRTSIVFSTPIQRRGLEPPGTTRRP